MDESSIESIHRVMTDISETKGQVKTIKDGIDSTLDQNDDYKRLKEELKELVGKRAELKKVMQSDKDYQKLASELEELRFKLKDLQEILSHHLVTYYNQTQNTEIQGPSGETQSFVVSAKLS